MKDTLTPAIAPLSDVISVLSDGLGSNLTPQEQKAFLSAYEKFQGHQSMTKGEVADVCRLTHKLSYTVNHLQEHGTGNQEYTIKCIQHYLDEILTA